LPAAADPHRQRAAWETFFTEALRATAGDGGEPADEAPPVTREELVGVLRGGKADDEGELAARPYTIANLLLSARDPAPFGAYRRAFASESEERLFGLLRSEVDAILIGVGTLRRGRYEHRLCEPGLRDRRLAKGLTRDPLGVVVSRSGHPPLEAPMFGERACEVAVFTSAPEPPPPCPAHVHLSRMGASDLTPRAVLGRLRREFGVRALLYEGGPTMLGALAGDGLLDEAFVTAEGPADAAAIRASTPLATVTEPEPLWDRQAGGTRLVRFRAQRSD
jgi:riboflavin biosynthesis pyrimidine reductase